MTLLAIDRDRVVAESVRRLAAAGGLRDARGRRLRILDFRPGARHFRALAEVDALDDERPAEDAA